MKPRKRARSPVLESLDARRLPSTGVPPPAVAEIDYIDGAPADCAAGYAQLDKYLTRTWYHAGLEQPYHADCSQAVYASMLVLLGRDKLDRLVGDIGVRGVSGVLNRESEFGPDFFRAVDAAKKRVRRGRRYVSLSEIDVAGDDRELADELYDLDAVVREVLDAREADLVRGTLRGESPTEIGVRWGVAAKTVSNEKSLVIGKLRRLLGC